MTIQQQKQAKKKKMMMMLSSNARQRGSLARLFLRQRQQQCWFVTFVAFLAMIATSSRCVRSSSNVPIPPPPPPPPLTRKKIASSSTIKDSSQASVTSSKSTPPTPPAFLQVFENEVWDSNSNKWKAANENDGGRWTASTSTTSYSSPSLSPSELLPPKGFEFVGDWKIVVTQGDTMGWEYQFHYLQPPKRRRIWLRSLQQQQQQQQQSQSPQQQQQKTKPKKKKKQKNNASTSLLVKQQQESSPSKIGLPSIIQPYYYYQQQIMKIIQQRLKKVSKIASKVHDAWNFKGFGLSLYKSLIFPESFGLALRLPLSINFEIFDIHPELPRLSSSVGLYYPWTIGTFLACSIHVEFVKYLLKYVIFLLPLRLVTYIIYSVIIPTIYKIISILLFPIRNHPIMTKNIPKRPIITINKPRYNPEVSERVGCTISYRWSMKRGLEWRVSYWHSYLPTLAKTFRRISLNSKNPPTLLNTKTIDWWQKHFGSLGLSTGYPIPSYPHFSCSANLSLSGLYLFQGKATTTTASSTTTTSKTSSSLLSSPQSTTAAAAAAAAQPTTSTSTSTPSSNNKSTSLEKKALKEDDDEEEEENSNNTTEESLVASQRHHPKLIATTSTSKK